jgi:AraC family L-rhamnose operon transcriptional activator RhaR
MIRPTETHKGETYFLNDLLLYVNRATEDFNLPLHNHDFIEFAYIAEGNGFHHIEEEVREVRKGQLYYIPIGTSHVFRPVSADSAKHPLIVYNCVFSPRLLTKLGEFVTDRTLKRYIESIIDGSEPHFYLIDAADSIEKVFLMLHREYALQRDGSTDYLYALLLQLLIVVIRVKQDPQTPPTRKLTHFEHLLTYIERNLSNELTLSHLSHISRWSERHLQRLFKQHTAQSFNRYLQSLRIQKSCEILRNTSFKISTVAEMAGYKDIASFVAVFKRNVGHTPSVYRKISSQLQ